MPESPKGKPMYVEVNGQQILFDSKVEIFVDSETGNWVVRTPISAESVLELLEDAVEHFQEIIKDELIECGMPDRTEESALLENVVVFPLTTTEFH